MGVAARSMAPAASRARKGRTAVPVVPRRRISRESRCRALFRVALTLMLALTAVGVGRVYVAARSAEAALDSGRIRAEITEQRMLGARLQVDKSALATPSRIQGIAGSTMEMSEPSEVRYMRFPPKEQVAGEASPAVADVSGAIAALLRFAAGEAQALLVGDLGLASSR